MLVSHQAQILAHNWGFAVFCILSLLLAGIMLLGGWLVGGRARARAKHVPFESGIDPVGTARLRFSAKFYLIAMIFVIVDAEILYLYAWAVSLREIDAAGFVEGVAFILLLLAGLVYLMRIGVLDWIPARSRRTLQNKEEIKVSRH
ncbi:NADH-quinone oxidoreductase subunit A [Acetobacteraceae bacterium]|nr:NADH-quinone oxidoreductase subunit A [Acetobacteraceae bacterium]